MVTSVVRDDDGVREENFPWEQNLLIVAIPDCSDEGLLEPVHFNLLKGQKYVSLVFFRQWGVPFDILKCQGRGCLLHGECLIKFFESFLSKILVLSWTAPFCHKVILKSLSKRSRPICYEHSLPLDAFLKG